MSLVLREEHPLLSNRRRDVPIAVFLVLATALLFVLVGLDSTRGWVQRIDDRALTQVVPNRTGPVTVAAKALNVLGGLAVMLVARILVAAYLAFRRRWWHLVAFLAAVVATEALVGPLKSVYDRPRPPGSLVGTSGASFPSGHAVAASVTVVAIVLALFPAGPHRSWWGIAAALFSFVMAISRAYLAAHWLSDAVAGTLLGVTSALVSALVVQWIRDAREGRRYLEPLEEETTRHPSGIPEASRPGR
jgi:membrane-associated phospholipid phosphatase